MNFHIFENLLATLKSRASDSPVMLFLTNHQMRFYFFFFFNDVHFCPTQWPLPKLPGLLILSFPLFAPFCSVDLPLKTE